MGKPSNAQLAAFILDVVGNGFIYGLNDEEEAKFRLAAQRLDGPSTSAQEISEAKVIAAAKAACEATKGGLCHFPNCLCEDAARKAIVAALEAAAREV